MASMTDAICDFLLIIAAQDLGSLLGFFLGKLADFLLFECLFIF